jgi:hypothetical protein
LDGQQWEKQGAFDMNDTWKTVAITAFAGLMCDSGADGGLATKSGPIVFVITGESNSGGIGLNSQATAAERAPRACVQIMNLTSGSFGFEDLKLGVNNLRDHFRLDGYYDTCHGFENQLANSVDAGVFTNTPQVYLIKTGQGSARMAQWAVGDRSGYWAKFLERINAAKRQLPANPQWVVWFSLGINDGIAHTPIDKWQEDTLAYLKRIKDELPGAVIVMTQFQSMRNYPQIDAALAKIAEEEARVFVVDSTGADLANPNHWNYAGLKTVAGRMAMTTKKALGL